MANKGFNGSTVSFSNSIAGLKSVSYQSQGAKVEVTGSDAAEKHFVAGIPDNSLTVTMVGGAALAVGQIATLSVAWFDNTATNFGNATVLSVGINGEEDGAITSTVTFAPAD